MAIAISPIHINSYNYTARTNTCSNNRVNFCSTAPLKIDYPDLKQYNIPKVGEYYCAPVSAANAIVAISNQGLPSLYPSNHPMKLINELGKVFKTTNQGTTTENLCKGLKAYAESKGYKADIKYQGFRDITPDIKSANIPDLNWIKNEINKNNAVLLNLGIYKKSIQNGNTVYTRHYGHFVTAVGAGNNGLSNASDYLIIHDPYNRVHGDHYIRAKQIKEGKFIHNKGDNEITLTDNAQGFLEIPQKLNYFEPDEVAVINGVVSFNVHK